MSMSASAFSVMGNECTALVSVLTAVLHGVGVYSQHWSSLYNYDSHGHRPWQGREIRHEGLWRTCTLNGTFREFDCVDIQGVSAWLLTVQILVAVSFGGVLVSTVLKLLYHFNPYCNNKALALGFILLSLFDGFLILLAVSIYAPNYKDRFALNLTSRDHHHHDDHYYKLSWGFTVEIVTVVLSVAGALLAMCEVRPYRPDYVEIVP